VNLFVAAFIGSPSMNFVEATVERSTVRFAGVEIAVPAGLAEPVNGPARRVVLGIRPTAFAPPGRDGWPTLTITPQVVEDLGDERYVIFDLDAQRVDTEAVRAALDARSADEVTLIRDEHARFTARLPADAPVPVGEPLAISVDPSRMYFFDPDTGLAAPPAAPPAG
jgi:multiple sugar transport system ATP-binding protein